MSKEFEVRRVVALPAEPDRVWEAIATAQGVSSWQFPPMMPLVHDTATVWDPPHRLKVRVEEGGWFNALEYDIEAAGGGSSVLRYVHSGIFTDDWDNQLDAVGQHTDFYLHTLGEYLAHFDGRVCTYVGEVPGGIVGPASSAAPDGFKRLLGALGVGDAGVGDHVTMTAPGGDLAGTVDYRTAAFLGVRTDDALYRFFGRNAFGAPVGMSIHSFAPGTDAPALLEAWTTWLNTELA